MTVGALPWRALDAGRWLVPAGALLAAVVLSDYAGFEMVDDRLFDAQARLIRAWRASQVERADADVRIVGIDQATLDRAGVPIALIHGVLGQALDAISRAGARAIAIDLVLPERSFDQLVPGADAALIRA